MVKFRKRLCFDFRCHKHVWKLSRHPLKISSGFTRQYMAGNKKATKENPRKLVEMQI